MADKDDILKAAQGILGGAQKVAAAVADKVENVAESVVGKDLDKDGSIGTPETEKLVADVKNAAGVVADKAQVAAGFMAEKATEAAGVVAEKAPVAAAAAVAAGKDLAGKAGAAIQGALKKEEVVEPEHVEVVAEEDPANVAADVAAVAAAVAAAADEAAEVVEEAASEE